MKIKQSIDIRLGASGYIHMGTYQGDTTATLRIDEDASNTELTLFHVDNRRLVNAIRYYLERLVTIQSEEAHRDFQMVRDLKEVAKVLANLEPEEVTSDA